MRIVALPVAVVIALASAAVAQPPSQDVDETLLVEFQGRVGPPSGGRVPAAELELDVDGERVRLQVEKAQVLRGQHFGGDVLDEMSPHRPSLYVRGPTPLLERIQHADPGERITLTGYYRSGSRNFLVSDVSPGDARSSASPR